MMQNQKTSSVRRTRALAIVPAIAFTLAMVNIPSVTNAFGHVADTSLDFMTAEIDSKVTNSQPSTQMPEQASSPAVDKKAECTPDKLPQFIGGEMELMRYLMDNVKYPAEAEKAGAQVQHLSDNDTCHVRLNGNIQEFPGRYGWYQSRELYQTENAMLSSLLLQSLSDIRHLHT